MRIGLRLRSGIRVDALRVRRACGRAAGLALTLALTACAPMPLVVYEPDVVGGTVLHSSCAFNGHVTSGVGFEVGGLAAKANLLPDAEGDLLVLQLEVPAGRTARWREATVAVATREPDSAASARLARVLLVDAAPGRMVVEAPELAPYRLPWDARLEGGHFVHGPVEFDRRFWMAVRLPSLEAEQVAVTLPAFEIDGRIVTWPLLRFHRRTIVAVALINC